METYLFLITGFPGSGKYTVAKALSAKLEAAGETVRLVDNHWINNPIFGLVEEDGVTPLPQEVWERVEEVAEAVVKTMARLTPPAWQLILTSYFDGVTDRDWFDRLAALAQSRSARFVPVRLVCDADENARRIVAPERRARMKSVDPREPHLLGAKGPPFDPGHPNTFTIDNTAVPPEEVADAIIAHAVALS